MTFHRVAILTEELGKPGKYDYNAVLRVRAQEVDKETQDINSVFPDQGRFLRETSCKFLLDKELLFLEI